MRLALFALPLMLTATPSLAAPAASQLPPELSDPAMADKLGRMAGVLAKSLMDLPVGELEAAVQGRDPTAADRAKRVPTALAVPTRSGVSRPRSRNPDARCRRLLSTAIL